MRKVHRHLFQVQLNNLQLHAQLPILHAQHKSRFLRIYPCYLGKYLSERLEREEMLSQVTDLEEGILNLFSLSAVHVNLYGLG